MNRTKKEAAVMCNFRLPPKLLARLDRMVETLRGTMPGDVTRASIVRHMLEKRLTEWEATQPAPLPQRDPVEQVWETYIIGIGALGWVKKRGHRLPVLSDKRRALLAQHIADFGLPAVDRAVADYVRLGGLNEDLDINHLLRSRADMLAAISRGQGA